MILDSERIRTQNIILLVRNDSLEVNYSMQLLGLILVLINLGAILGPVAGVAIIYRDNIDGLIIPPEVAQLIDEAAKAGSKIEPPQLMSYTYDQYAKTATMMFSFTNPLSLNVTVNSLAANVVCNGHSLILGRVEITSPAELNQDVTAYITAVFAWTAAAETHLMTAHSSQSTISVSLRDIIVDVSGITVETPTSYDIGEIPIPQV